jgi:hypothetical protein
VLKDVRQSNVDANHTSFIDDEIANGHADTICSTAIRPLANVCVATGGGVIASVDRSAASPLAASGRQHPPWREQPPHRSLLAWCVETYLRRL